MLSNRRTKDTFAAASFIIYMHEMGRTEEGLEIRCLLCHNFYNKGRIMEGGFSLARIVFN